MIRMKERSRLEFLGICLLQIVPFTVIWVVLGVLGASMIERYVIEFLFCWFGLLVLILPAEFAMLYFGYFK
ncbi:MAG: hypothetical protein ACKKMO_00300 [Candidatus Nealsonbacteria bacterium]